MRLRHLLRRRRADTATSAREALEDAKRATESLKRYDPQTSADYATPFDGGQYPGTNPGGPY